MGQQKWTHVQLWGVVAVIEQIHEFPQMGHFPHSPSPPSVFPTIYVFHLHPYKFHHPTLMFS